MADAHHVEAGDQADLVGEVQGSQDGVRVLRRAVDHEVVEVRTKGTGHFPHDFARERHSGWIRSRPEPPQRSIELGAESLDFGLPFQIPDRNQVLQRPRGLLPEIRERVADPEFQVEERDVLFRHLRERGGQIDGQEGLSGPALGGEHRDHGPLGLLGSRHLGGAERAQVEWHVGGFQDHVKAELFADALHQMRHRLRRGLPVGFLAELADELAHLEVAALGGKGILLDGGGQDQEVRSAPRIGERGLRGRHRGHPVDALRIGGQGASDLVPERRWWSDSDDAAVRHQAPALTDWTSACP